MLTMQTILMLIIQRLSVDKSEAKTSKRQSKSSSNRLVASQNGQNQNHLGRIMKMKKTVNVAYQNSFCVLCAFHVSFAKAVPRFFLPIVERPEDRYVIFQASHIHVKIRTNTNFVINIQQ